MPIWFRSGLMLVWTTFVWFDFRNFYLVWFDFQKFANLSSANTHFRQFSNSFLVICFGLFNFVLCVFYLCFWCHSSLEYPISLQTKSFFSTIQHSTLALIGISNSTILHKISVSVYQPMVFNINIGNIGNIDPVLTEIIELIPHRVSQNPMRYF